MEAEGSDPRSHRIDILSGEHGEQPGMTPSTYVLRFQTRNPIWKLSPWHNGSALYDSYELRAVTHQLNKAIQGSSALSSPYICKNLRSPFCLQRLDSIYKQNAKKTQRRISGRQAAHAIQDKDSTPARSRGFVKRLWKKLKQGLFRSKQKSDP